MDRRKLDIKNLIKSNRVFYAHKAKNGDYETLAEHTYLCEKYFDRLWKVKDEKRIFDMIIKQSFSEEISTEGRELFYDMWNSVPSFHDLGKINPVFQRERMKSDKVENVSDYTDLGSHHSMLSAVMYLDYFANKIKDISDKEERMTLRYFSLLNSYVISRHHSDMGSFEKYLNEFWFGGAGYKIVKKMRHNGNVLLNNEMYLDTDDDKVIGLLIHKVESYIDSIDEEDGIFLYCYERLLYSLLIASDYYATTEFMENFEVQDSTNEKILEEFSKAYNENSIIKGIRKYEKKDYYLDKDLVEAEHINTLRNEIFLESEKNLISNLEENIFYLEAPTGSGKSNTAFNLSFLLSKKNELKKIFYVYPFNTLVEQNVISLNKTFEHNKGLKENITVINSITPIKLSSNDEDNNKNLYKKAYLNRQFLNYPLILTTNISLFKLLFDDNQNNLMGFHQLMNSVIVLDEIQSYKNIIWTEIIMFLHIFSKLLNMKIIIMSATLPNLNILLNKNNAATQLIKEPKKYYRHPLFANRVFIHYELLYEKMDFRRLYNHMRNLFEGSNKKVLVEFLSKSSAEEFYNEVKRWILEDKLEAEVKIMTGSDNSFDRKKIIKWVKQEENTFPLILVATQVVEAGIDIDMDIGYKDFSIFDNEEQFMGRINRSCSKKGNVYFFNFNEARAIYRNDIRVNQEFTLINKEMQKILVEKDFKKYYELILNQLKNNFNIAGDELNVKAFFQNAVTKLDFNEIKNRMKLIEENSEIVHLFIPYEIKNENGETIKGGEIWNKYKSLLANEKLDYSEKQIKLFNIKTKMDYFIYEMYKYEIFKIDFYPIDQIGEIYLIEDSEHYFENGRFNKSRYLELNKTVIL